MNFKIWEMFRTYYIVTDFWFFLTLISFLYLLIRVDKPARKKLILIVIFSIVFLLNDVSYAVLTKIFDEASYYRFLWVMPYCMLIAYTIMQCILDIVNNSNALKNKAMAVLILIFSVGLLKITNLDYITQLRANIPQNIYLVSNDMLQIKQIIDAEKEKGSCGSEPVLACSREVMMQYQTIDAGCVISTGRDVYLQIRDNGEDIDSLGQDRKDKYLLSTICEDNSQLDEDEATQAMGREQVDYIIVHAGADMENYMESLGASLAGRTQSYLVYKYK